MPLLGWFNDCLPTTRHLVAISGCGIRQEAIVYGDADGYPLVLDLFVPEIASPNRRPAVILLHGGGWVFGISGAHDMWESASRFAEAGYVAASVEYRRTGEPGQCWQWPDPLHDCQRAVRWLRTHAEQYRIDPDCIVAYGHSAGGQLAAMLAVRDEPSISGVSSRSNGSIVLAGHMDVRIPYTDAFARESLTALLGGIPDDIPAQTTDASPITWVDARTAPMLLLHGAADHQVVPAHHRSMADALRVAGITVTVVDLPEADHFTIAEWSCAGPWSLAFIASIATNICHSVVS